tara:strand:+ start:8824 stop:9111 length:288 start_codon:yes stop_codon:yes gene_type:complete
VTRVEIRGVPWYVSIENQTMRRPLEEKAIRRPWYRRGLFWEIRHAGKDGRTGVPYFTTHLLHLSSDGTIREHNLTHHMTPMSTSLVEACRIAEEE